MDALASSQIQKAGGFILDFLGSGLAGQGGTAIHLETSPWPETRANFAIAGKKAIW